MTATYQFSRMGGRPVPDTPPERHAAPSLRALAEMMDTSPSTAQRARAAQQGDPGGWSKGKDGRCYPANEGTRRILAQAVIDRLVEHPDWSLRRIAADLHGWVSPATVLRYRRMLEEQDRSGVAPETPEHDVQEREPAG